jgi:phenylpropionate dioxygenase-like ring-hydroxylating dioxygenase large terminal subunit
MGYVRNAWYVAGWSPDLGQDALTPVQILGEPIVLWRTGQQLVALADRCVHRLAPLSLGRCEGSTLRCMYHGLRYDTQGQCIQIPGQDVIPRGARVRSYPSVDRHSWIWVWMGDPARADATLIPPAVGLEEPEWLLGRGQLDYQAEACYINDNLLDFSHLSYVHANSFGAGPSFAEERPKLTALEQGVRFERWNLATKGPVGRSSEELTDNWMTYDFLIPGVLLMWSGSFKLGTAAASNYERPDYSQAIRGVTFTSQAVTPLGDRSARYFFSWGPHRRHGDEALRDLLMKIAAQAFGEDKTMIEAQQRIIDRTPDPVILPTAHDRGVTMFNRLVARLAREEASGSPQRQGPALTGAIDAVT